MIMDDIELYRKSLEATLEYGESLCGKLQESLKPVIPDIQIGTSNNGIDVISFDSVNSNGNKEDFPINLIDIVKSVFPELTVESHYGVKLTVEQGKQAYDILKKLRE